MKAGDVRRLAARLQAGADDPVWNAHCEMDKATVGKAAAALLRLLSERDELLAFARWCNSKQFDSRDLSPRADAAIAKASERN
jgi:hypothetical protein